MENWWNLGVEMNADDLNWNDIECKIGNGKKKKYCRAVVIKSFYVAVRKFIICCPTFCIVSPSNISVKFINLRKLNRTSH